VLKGKNNCQPSGAYDGFARVLHAEHKAATDKTEYLFMLQL
jgi:hypothetical protein